MRSSIVNRQCCFVPSVFLAFLPRMTLSFLVCLSCMLASMLDSGVVLAAAAVDLGRSHSFQKELPPQREPPCSRRMSEHISEPTIRFSNLQLDLVHTVGGQVQSNEVRIDLFEDRECSVPLMNRDTYIAVDVFRDLSDDGDGSGTSQVCTSKHENVAAEPGIHVQSMHPSAPTLTCFVVHSAQMTVQYTINPSTISGSPIISYSSAGTAVAFCTRLSLIDPDRQNETVEYLDYPVALYIDILERFEILGLVIENPEDSYGVEAFLCDSNNLRIDESNETLQRNQGSRVRICVQPDSHTQDSGVVMKSINRLKLSRGNVVQDVLMASDVEGSYYHCVAGESICHVETEISNRFFDSQGFVRVEGDVWMQYAFSNNRRIVGLPLRQNVMNEPPSQLVPVASPIWNRRGTEVGNFIGSRYFDLEFEVSPFFGATNWQAEAFLCDGRNQRLQSVPLTRPRKEEDTVRVCVMPQPAARESGIYVREISSFSFEQGGKVQVAIEPSGIQAENSIFICNAGEPLCVLKTKLSRAFFDQRTNVIGEGELVLQYGTEPRARVLTGRALLQDEDDPKMDPGFAGRVKVSIQFMIDHGYGSSWWHDNGVFQRMGYVLAILFGFLIFLCCLFAIGVGNSFSRTKIFPQGLKRSWRLLFPSVIGMDADADAEKGPSSSKSETSMETSPQTVDDTCTTETRSIPGHVAVEPTQRTQSGYSESNDTLARQKSLGKLRSEYSKSATKQRCGEVTQRVQTTPSPKKRIAKPKRISVPPDRRPTGQEAENGASSCVMKSPRNLKQKQPPIQNHGISSIKWSIPRTVLTLSKMSPSTLNASHQAPILENHPTDLNIASKSFPTRSGKRALDLAHTSRAVSFPMKMDLNASVKATVTPSRRPTQSSNPLSTLAHSSSISAMTPPLTSPQREKSYVPSGRKTKQSSPIPGASPGGRRASLSGSRSNHGRKPSPFLLDHDGDDDADRTKNDSHHENRIIPHTLTF
jgi:hypothetical protein